MHRETKSELGSGCQPVGSDSRRPGRSKGLPAHPAHIRNICDIVQHPLHQSARYNVQETQSTDDTNKTCQTRAPLTEETSHDSARTIVTKTAETKTRGLEPCTPKDVNVIKPFSSRFLRGCRHMETAPAGSASCQMVRSRHKPGRKLRLDMCRPVDTELR